MLAASNRIRTVQGAAPLVVITAAAWAALAAGVGGHDHASLGGWLLMVAAMMLPPEIATATRAGGVIVATAAVWTGFAVVALSVDALVHRAAGAHGGHGGGVADLIAPVVLIGAGVFQLSAVRRRMLVAARNPAMSPWRHALYCLGGCWALMLVMVAAGLGNLAVMAALTVVMTVERVAGERLEALTGYLVGVTLAGVGAVAAYA